MKQLDLFAIPAPVTIAETVTTEPTDLRRAGVEVVITRTKAGSTIQLEKTGEIPSIASPSSPAPATAPTSPISASAKVTVLGAGIRKPPSIPSPESRTGDPINADGDGIGAGDGILRPFSGTTPDGWAPEAWAARLRQMADRCEESNPARAAELRAQATCAEPAE